MRIRLLGAVEACRGDGGPAPLSGLRLRGLLARLALDAGRVVTADALVDALWTDPPDNAPNALQALVSRLRRALGGTSVATAAGGYRLAVDPDDVDALAFTRLATAAAGAEPARAHGLLGQALALWRGRPLEGLAELPFAAAAATRLAEGRAAAVEGRARAALRLGVPVDLDGLATLLTAEPLRETAAVLLARGLHAAGRQADALAALDRTAATLADELGVDPGPDLAATRLAVLRGPAQRARSGLTSFVGRDADVSRVRELLEQGRLVTLVGPGGAGKTRLAREATGDAAVVAELAALTDADQLAAAVLDAVGEPELLTRHVEDTDPLTRLRAALERRATLLVLDNCEHLVEGVAKLVAGLLDDCRDLRILATSREPLCVPGETLHPVEALAAADAARLFADRGAAVRPGFTLAGVEDAVADICRRLDGQPLPIELAAARLRTLTPREIADRLDDRFRLLTSGARTALPRHQTLRAVVDWSWDLLAEPERATARRLSVFAGGASMAAAERVCGPEAFETLASLVDKSLVVAVAQADASTRYRMLETVRAYAGERLAEAGERAEAEAAHAAVFLALTEEAEPHLRRAEQLTWLARLRAEADELDVALRRAAVTDPAVAYRLLVTTSWSWLIRGRMDEIRRWLRLLPEVPSAVPAADRALAATLAAIARISAGDLAGGRRHAEAALAVLDAVPRPWHPLLELVGPVHRVFVDGDDGPLRALADGNAADPWVRAIALQALAARAEDRGAAEEQRRLYRAAHEAFRAVGDRFGLGMVVYSLGELENLAGDHEAAAVAFDEAIALATDLGNEEDLHQYLAGRGLVEARRGDLDAARRLLARAGDLAGPLPSGALPDPWPAGAVVAVAMAEVERRAGDLDAARTQLDRVAAATAQDEQAFALPQRGAYLAVSRALVELAADDVPAARELLRGAARDALAGRDGPVVALVAEAAALLAHAEGDAAAAAAMLGVAAGERGTLDRGSPEVVALLAALGPESAAVIAGAPAGRADGAARLAGFLNGDGRTRAPDVP